MRGSMRTRWSENLSGKCSYERPTRGTLCGTMRSMCGADAGCLAINCQSLSMRGPGLLEPTTTSTLWHPSTGGALLFLFFTLVTGPRRSLRLKLSDTRVYEPQIRARLGTTAQEEQTIFTSFMPCPPKHLHTASEHRRGRTSALEATQGQMDSAGANG